MVVGRRGTEPDEVEGFEDAEGVDNKQGDEPPFLSTSSSVPEREAFEDDGPEQGKEKERGECKHEFRHKRSRKRGDVLHICGLYHTLYPMRYLGVDYGSKKIGLALSDEVGVMGFPHAIIPNTPRIVDELCVLIAKENIGAVVIGESRTLAGGENPIAEGARALGSALTERAGVPVFYESEVFTSAEARRAPEKQMKSRAPKKHIAVDSSAAALILTSYLSRIDHE